jgi:hypothetical protein
MEIAIRQLVDSPVSRQIWMARFNLLFKLGNKAVFVWLLFLLRSNFQNKVSKNLID